MTYRQRLLRLEAKSDLRHPKEQRQILLKGAVNYLGCHAALRSGGKGWRICATGNVGLRGCSRSRMTPQIIYRSPLDIGSRCGNKLKTPDLKHREFATRKTSGQGLETGEIHRGEIAAKFLVAANALIVVQEVAASVEDQSILVAFDGLRVVRGMAVDKRNIGPIDEGARKSSLLFRTLISPICSPMNGCNHQIAWPPYALRLFRDPRDAFIGKVGDKVHAGGHWSHGPFKERFNTIERVIGWEDKFCRLLLRFERLNQLHYAFKSLAYTMINLRHFCQG
jgi:hypothetical protein